MDTINSQQIQEKAIKLFNSGFNCSQSVLAAFSDNLKLDNNIALSIACGFGAGMGRLQGTCGAVTGAYMVLGTCASNKFADNEERKEKSYSMIQDFNRGFIEKHKTTECKFLLNCDLNTEEGRKQFQRDKLRKAVCKPCIKDSIQLVIEQIEK